MLGDGQYQPYQIRLAREPVPLVNALHVPSDRALLPRLRHRDVAHGPAFRQPRRPSLSAGVNPSSADTTAGSMRGLRSGSTTSTSAATFRAPSSACGGLTGLTCTTSGSPSPRRRSGLRASHRGAGSRNRPRQQPLEPGVVGRSAGTQRPAAVRQPVPAPQQHPGSVAGRHDAPPPVQVQYADPRVVEQPGHGRTQRTRSGQRLPDPDELPHVRQQPLQQPAAPCAPGPPTSPGRRGSTSGGSPGARPAARPSRPANSSGP